jgi:hypothetical protein
MNNLYKLFFILALFLFLVPQSVFASCCPENKEVQIYARLALNDTAKECRLYLAESIGGFYKQMPTEEWRLMKFKVGDIELFKKYCATIGYGYNDTVLLPMRWVTIGWKINYVIASLILAAFIMALPFLRFRKKSSQ